MTESALAPSFSDLGLLPVLAHAAATQGYDTPTPVQTRSIPQVLQGRDLQACAPTGSGKTAAFMLPLLQQWLQAPRQQPRRLQLLVLVPTRELASQVAEQALALTAAMAESPRLVRAIGGVSINPQLLALRGGADIVVATPGRALDLVTRNALRLDGLQTLVLDEADRLLDLGFADELQQLLRRLPLKRQTLLFSATFPPGVQALAASLLRDPVLVEAPLQHGAPPDIVQRAIVVDTGRRTQLLRHLVTTQGWRQVLVFVATKLACETVSDKLRKAGLAAEPLHGQLSQGKRTQVLADFKAARVQVVVATDLAARGIDIVQLPAVVNFDLARSPTEHVHRIGRTGRAGASGLAISFVPASAEAHFQLIEKRQQHTVPREQVPGFEAKEAAPPTPADPHGGIKGHRPSKKDKLRAAAAQAAALQGQGTGQ
jgi:ATP-dependent RNA helicase RhlE